MRRKAEKRGLVVDGMPEDEPVVTWICRGRSGRVFASANDTRVKIPEAPRHTPLQLPDRPLTRSYPSLFRHHVDETNHQAFSVPSPRFREVPHVPVVSLRQSTVVLT